MKRNVSGIRSLTVFLLHHPSLFYFIFLSFWTDGAPQSNTSEIGQLSARLDAELSTDDPIIESESSKSSKTCVGNTPVYPNAAQRMWSMESNSG